MSYLRSVEKLAREPVPDSPLEYAARLAERYAARSSNQQRSNLGQYFTSIEVGRFMAALARDSKPAKHILDPGAGTGVLACAVCETLHADTREVHLDAFEVDSLLADLCAESLGSAREWLSERGVKFTFSVHRQDFVLNCASSLAPHLFARSEERSYDLIIANPPYFKLQKSDPRSLAAIEVVHGQPNIYAIFMAISASLLAENGVMVTITPRSFATGDYFSRCRRHVFSRVVPEAVHLFRSRKLAFKSDAVLQENVILRARKTKPKPTAMVDVSASDGPEDIQQRNSRPVKLGSVLEISSPRAIFHIPVDGLDDALVRFVRGWPKTLHTLGLEVSTGPVVAFRARRFLTSDFTAHAQGAPLLWLQNIRQMTIDWPLTRLKKPQSIVDSKDSRGILIQNKNYVVLRRFTTKEEPRRLIAAPLIRETLPGRMIGLENHLNYVHRPHGEVGEEEAFGLAAVLGSSLLDQYFRISNGNTQVNAAELRCLPLPARETLVLLGREVRPRLGLPADLDFVTDDILGVPDKLRRTSKAG